MEELKIFWPVIRVPRFDSLVPNHIVAKWFFVHAGLKSGTKIGGAFEIGYV